VDEDIDKNDDDTTTVEDFEIESINVTANVARIKNDILILFSFVK
jgi:hypothetical protein